MTWWVRIAFGVATAGCSLAMLVLYARRRQVLKSWRPVTGLVVDSPCRPDGSYQEERWLVVEFTDRAGVVQRVTAGSGSSSFPALGTSTQVWEHPRQPARSLIDVDLKNQRLLMPILCVVFGICVLAIVFLP